MTSKKTLHQFRASIRKKWFSKVEHQGTSIASFIKIIANLYGRIPRRGIKLAAVIFPRWITQTCTSWNADFAGYATVRTSARTFFRSQPPVIPLDISIRLHNERHFHRTPDSPRRVSRPALGRNPDFQQIEISKRDNVKPCKSWENSNCNVIVRNFLRYRTIQQKIWNLNLLNN